MTSKKLFYGIDFSGSKTAGKSTWVSCLKRNGSKQPKLVMCSRAKDLPESDTDRDVCYSALKKLIIQQPNAAFGFDFSFGLPKALLNGFSTWREGIEKLAEKFNSPEEFKQYCHQMSQDRASGEKELKRQTEVERQAPFSPYNLRIYKQTYFGMKHILLPLIRQDHAKVLPMQEATPDYPWLMEICPASTLKELKLYIPAYKGKQMEHYRSRESILNKLLQTHLFLCEDSDVINMILTDTGGDALDSLIAAIACYRGVNEENRPHPYQEPYLTEGYIYT